MQGLERKKILEEIVITSDKIAVSKVIENKGIELFKVNKKAGVRGSNS